MPEFEAPPGDAQPRLQGDTHVRGGALTPAVRRRLAILVGDVLDGGRLVRVSRLTGGLWAHMHALDVDLPGGARRRLALRRYVRWQTGSGPDGSCQRHGRVLALLRGSGLPVAELLWADSEGEVLDVPALMTSLLPGRSSLTLAATPTGLDRLAAALAEVNRVEASEALESPGGFAGWVDAALVDRVPRWLADCPDADEVLSALRSGAGAAKAPMRLAHGDFHAGNVLWTGSGSGLRLTGIVDWDVADAAPIGSDVGYCRADLAMAFGQREADAFRLAYRRHAGTVPDPAWWDLLGAALCWSEFREWLPAYQVFGVRQLTAELMEHRLITFTCDALRRMPS